MYTQDQLAGITFVHDKINYTIVRVDHQYGYLIDEREPNKEFINGIDSLLRYINDGTYKIVTHPSNYQIF